MALIAIDGRISFARDLKTGKRIKLTDGQGLTPEGRDHLEYMGEVCRDIVLTRELGIDYNPVRDRYKDGKEGL